MAASSPAATSPRRRPGYERRDCRRLPVGAEQTAIEDAANFLNGVSGQVFHIGCADDGLGATLGLPVLVQTGHDDDVAAVGVDQQRPGGRPDAAQRTNTTPAGYEQRLIESVGHGGGPRVSAFLGCAGLCRGCSSSAGVMASARR
jgi:hypothetical protein